MSKHTPGPWRADYRPLASRQRWAVFHNGHHVLAEIDQAYNIEANARLIAASPELLNAVKLIEILAGGNGCAEGESVTLAPKTLEQLRKAIAKAEGKD